jgi:hypothetical protein
MLKIKQEKSLTREVALIEIGVPNSTGNIYSEKSVNKIFEILAQREYLTGELVYNINPDGKYETKLEEASHIIKNMFIDDGFLVAVVNFKSTRNGKDALKMYEDGTVTFRPTIRGKITEYSREIIINDIISVDLIPINDKVLQKEINWITVK